MTTIWSAFALALFLTVGWRHWRRRLDPHSPLWLRHQLRAPAFDVVLFLALLALTRLAAPPLPAAIALGLACGSLMTFLLRPEAHVPLPPLESAETAGTEGRSSSE